MTEAECDVVIAVLAGAFPQVVSRFSAAQARAWHLTYTSAMADLDFDDTKAAAERLVKSSQWVSIAELRAAVVTVKIGQVRTGVEAWGEVLRKIGSKGMNRPPGEEIDGRSWNFDDALTAQAVDGLGWRELCLSENQAADRARFIQTYEQLAKQGREQAQISGGASAPALPDRRGREAKQLADLLPKMSQLEGSVHDEECSVFRRGGNCDCKAKKK
jgi:hypothetical protein